MPPRRKSSETKDSADSLGGAAGRWLMANKINMGAGEYPNNWCTYDPASGSGGMFVQSEKFVESHGGNLGDISIYGEDKWARRQRPFGLAKRARRVRLRGQQPKQSNAIPNRLALRDIQADFGPEHADAKRYFRDSSKIGNDRALAA